MNPYTLELKESVQEILKEHPEVEAEELDSAWREFLQRQRLTLTELLANRGITEEVFDDLVSRIDSQLEERKITWDSLEDIDNALWQVHTPRSDPDTDSDQPASSNT